MRTLKVAPPGSPGAILAAKACASAPGSAACAHCAVGLPLWATRGAVLTSMLEIWNAEVGCAAWTVGALVGAQPPRPARAQAPRAASAARRDKEPKDILSPSLNWRRFTARTRAGSIDTAGDRRCKSDSRGSHLSGHNKSAWDFLAVQNRFLAGYRLKLCDLVKRPDSDRLCSSNGREPQDGEPGAELDTPDGAHLHLPFEPRRRGGRADEGLAREPGVRERVSRQGQDDRHPARRRLGEDALPRGRAIPGLHHPS